MNKLHPRLRVMKHIVTQPWTLAIEKIQAITAVAQILKSSPNVKKFFKLLVALGNYINLSVEVK